MAILDDRAAEGFTAALEQLTRCLPHIHPEPPPRPVMFAWAYTGAEQQIVQVAREGGKDLICLGFRPGRVDRGPVGIAVHRLAEGAAKSWSCALWAAGRRGPVVILPEDERFSFRHDGIALVVVRGRPTRNVHNGLDHGRAMLKRAVLQPSR